MHGKQRDKQSEKRFFLVLRTDAWFLCLSFVDNGHNEFDITIEKYYNLSWFETIATSLYLPEKAKNSIMYVVPLKSVFLFALFNTSISCLPNI